MKVFTNQVFTRLLTRLWQVPTSNGHVDRALSSQGTSLRSGVGHGYSHSGLKDELSDDCMMRWGEFLPINFLLVSKLGFARCKLHRGEYRADTESWVLARTAFSLFLQSTKLVIKRDSNITFLLSNNITRFYLALDVCSKIYKLSVPNRTLQYILFTFNLAEG